MFFWMTGIRSLRARTIAAAALVGLTPATALAAPAVGDVYVYRVGNGFISGSALGRVRYRIEKIGADSIEVSLSADNPRAGSARSVIYTKDGNWRRHQINNHDQPVDYEFATPFPAYVFPLEPGKDWSLRVEGASAATGKRNSIRVDGDVLGVERITVPAGTFETVKVRPSADSEASSTATSAPSAPVNVIPVNVSVTVSVNVRVKTAGATTEAPSAGVSLIRCAWAKAALACRSSPRSRSSAHCSASRTGKTTARNW